MNKNITHAIAWFLTTLGFVGATNAQGLIVNELSNGPSGNQEYIEMVVVGPDLNPNCGPVDLTGWIIDDNNGDFSCGACAGTGIASGHLRFGTTGVWSAVPTGAIIVIYDAAVKNPRIPADDPNDTAPADGVYILSTSHASLEVAVTPCGGGQVPSAGGSCGSCSGVSTYASACYSAGVANATTGLRNTGDAAQVRRPDGSYFHGVGFGTAASLITGGPDGLLISGDGTGRCYSFTNAVNNNFRSVANFGSATVASLGETPGAANSANNATWITSLGTPCLLAVNYYHELSVQPGDGINVLTWTTASEINSDRWDILRSTNLAEGFVKIGVVEAHGNTQQLIDYQYADINPEQANVWYQLRQIDADGGAQNSNVVQVTNSSLESTFFLLWPNPSNGKVQIHAALEGAYALHVTDLMGRTVVAETFASPINFLERELDLSALQAGNYIVQLWGSHGLLTRRISLQPTR